MGNPTRQPLKTLYRHYHNSYGYQIWQGGDLPLLTPTHKVKRLFDYLVSRDRAINKKIISPLPQRL